MVPMLTQRISALAVSVLLVTLTGNAAELVQVSENEDGTRAINLLDPVIGSTSVVSASFGQVGTPIFLGGYVSADGTHIGATEASSAAATWRLIDRSGVAAGEITLGKAADIFVAGADFNGDGILDPAVLENSSRSLRVRVKPGAFSATPGAEVVRPIGLKSDRSRAFFANLDGRGDKIGIVRKLPGFPTAKPRYQIRLTDPITGAKRTVVLSAVGEISAAPLPLRQIDGSDALVVQRRFTGLTNGVRVTVLRGNGKKRAGVTFNGEGELVVADLDVADPGEEIGFHSGTSLTIFNPNSRARRSITVTDGTLIDAITVAEYEATPTGPLACGGTPGICGCNMLDTTDGYKVGFVYKAKSDTYGGLVAVLPNPCGRSTTAVTVLDTNCNPIEELSDNGYGNADLTGVRHHFKRRDDHTGSYYRNLYGSIILRLEGTDACYFIENPAQSRID